MTRFLVAAAAVLALAACGSGGDTDAAPADAAPADVCPAVERLDPAAVLGGPAAKHRACQADTSVSALGTAVWTAAGGRRVSVSVLAGAATFQQHYDRAPAARRCALPESGGGDRRCIDQLSTGRTDTGSLTVEFGATYLSVWMSEEGGDTANIDVPADVRPAFLDFVATAVRTIYGRTVTIPASLRAAPAAAPTSPASPDSPASPAFPAAGGDLAAQLARAGYERTSTGSFDSPDLGRKVTMEDWKATGRPTVALSDARTSPGTLAIAELQYEDFGRFTDFSCIPTTKFASDLRWTLDQSDAVREQVRLGTTPLKIAPGTTDRHMLDNADRSLTCYMK
jgi:hypothetical protein